HRPRARGDRLRGRPGAAGVLRRHHPAAGAGRRLRRFHAGRRCCENAGPTAHDARMESSAFATLPPPPYYAVIFSSARTGADEAGYAEAAGRMVELARRQPGFLGVERCAAPTASGSPSPNWRAEGRSRPWPTPPHTRPTPDTGGPGGTATSSSASPASNALTAGTAAPRPTVRERGRGHATRRPCDHVRRVAAPRCGDGFRGGPTPVNRLLRPSLPHKDDILQRILARKAEEVAARSAARPLAEMRAQAADMPPARGFAAAIEARIAAGDPAVIAEIKKASPSR